MKAFAKIHPFVLMIYFLTIVTVSMFVSNPVIKLLSLAGAFLFSFMLTDKKEKLHFKDPTIVKHINTRELLKI